MQDIPCVTLSYVLPWTLSLVLLLCKLKMCFSTCKCHLPKQNLLKEKRKKERKKSWIRTTEISWSVRLGVSRRWAVSPLAIHVDIFTFKEKKKRAGWMEGWSEWKHLTPFPLTIDFSLSGICGRSAAVFSTARGCGVSWGCCKRAGEGQGQPGAETSWERATAEEGAARLVLALRVSFVFRFFFVQHASFLPFHPALLW